MDKAQRRELNEWQSAIRRDFHRHPETSYEEHRTTSRIKEILDGLGIDNRTFDDVTGVVGLMGDPAKGPTLGLRADIDALPVMEKTGAEYASEVPGKMHACGHDSHPAIMLGVARLLKESGMDEKLPGCVKFIFQPAEEGGAGARALMEHGVLKDPDVDWILAGHASPDIPVGSFSFYRTKSHASTDTFKLVITGAGGHGGRPHQGVDPVVAAAQFINSAQTIVSRNVSPIKSGVVSIGSLHGGKAGNVIPDQVELSGTIRALSPDVRELIHERLSEIVKGLEFSHRVECELAIMDGYPACIGDERVSSFMHDLAIEMYGPDSAAFYPPVTGGEDFSFYLEEIPGSLCRLGCRNEQRGIVHPLHSPLFDMDEEMMVIGAEFFHQCVLRYFKLG